MILNINKHIETIIPALLGLIAITTIYWWMSFDSTTDLIEHHPGMDNQPANRSASAGGESIEIGSYFQKFADLDDSLAGEWTQFRGTDNRNIIENGVKLAGKMA